MDDVQDPELYDSATGTQPPYMADEDAGSPPGLGPDQLNDLDNFILDFLNEHEWATPQLIRIFYNEARAEAGKDDISGSYVSRQMGRLREHNYIEYVRPDSRMQRLVSDPRE